MLFRSPSRMCAWHRTEDLLDQGSTNHRLLGGREEHAGHAVGCPSRWEPPVPWPKRIRAGYAELLKPCAERAPDEGDIEDKVLAPTNARTFTTRWTTPNRNRVMGHELQGQEEYDGLGPQNHQMRPTRFVAIRAFMAQVHGSLGPDGLQWRG